MSAWSSRQPDRPSGRGMELAASPVKQARPGTRISRSRSRKNQEQRRVPRAADAHSSRTRLSSSAMDASFRNGCSIFRRWATSTCMLRCCRNIAAPRPFNGRSRTAKPSPASPPCASMPDSIPATFCCNRTPHLVRDTAETLVAETGRDRRRADGRNFGGCERPRSAKPQDQPRDSLAPILKKEDGQIDFRAPPRKSAIVCADFNRGRALSPAFGERIFKFGCRDPSLPKYPREP